MATRDPLDPFALGIGRLCHAWAELEKAVAAMFVVIVGIDIPHSVNIQVFSAMVDCLDLRDVVKAVKVGAIGSAKNDDEYEWGNSLVEALDYIDNVLRLMRNRYVHDPWWHDYRGVMRATTAPRVIKPQAFQRRQVEFWKLHPGNKTELRTLIAEVKRYDKWLWAMYYWREGDPPPSRLNPPLAELLSKRPQQRLPLPPPETPSQKGKARAKQKLPPRS